MLPPLISIDEPLMPAPTDPAMVTSSTASIVTAPSVVVIPGLPVTEICVPFKATAFALMAPVPLLIITLPVIVTVPCLALTPCPFSFVMLTVSPVIVTFPLGVNIALPATECASAVTFPLITTLPPAEIAQPFELVSVRSPSAVKSP